MRRACNLGGLLVALRHRLARLGTYRPSCSFRLFHLIVYFFANIGSIFSQRLPGLFKCNYRSVHA